MQKSDFLALLFPAVLCVELGFNERIKQEIGGWGWNGVGARKARVWGEEQYRG